MHRSLCILIAVLCALSQEPAREELPIDQELAALIEKTNALQTFHVIYDMERSEDGESESASMEIVYRAPDLGRLRSSPEAEIDFWSVGKRAYFLADGTWRSAVFPEPSPVHALLDELFPPEAKSLEPGLSLRMVLAHQRFELTLGRYPEGRSHVLGWLEDMQRRPSALAVEGDRLCWNGDGVRCFVSRATGFLERVEAKSENGHLNVLLRECHLDEPLDPALVTVPDEARNAALDPGLGRKLAQLLGPRAARPRGFLRVERQLDSGKRAWNELARNDWRTFLDGLHRELIEEVRAGPLEESEKRIDQLVAWVRARRSEDDSAKQRVELDRTVARFRASLEENLDKTETQYTSSLPPIEPEEVEPRQELFAIELEVIAKLCDQLLRQPVLASFDRKLAAAFEE